MPKHWDYKTFEVNNQITIRCHREATRYGFRHLAEMYVPGHFTVTAKVCYYNRTWESFEFQSVIMGLTRKPGVTDAIREAIKQFAGRGGKAEVEEKEKCDSMFKTIGAVMALGSIMTDNQKDENDWKARMVKAGLGGHGLIMPDNWDQLSEDEKTSRLAKLQEFALHPETKLK